MERDEDAEIAALRDAHARIVAYCMEWTQHVRIGKGGLCRTDEIGRFVDEIRGIAGQAMAAEVRKGRQTT